MIPGLAIALVASSLVVGVWAGVAAGRARRVSGAQLAAAAAVEVLLLVQAVVAVAVWAAGSREIDGWTFAGYLLTSVLLLPVGAFWAIGERSRWGNGVLALTGLVVAVIVLRLLQVWGAGG